MYCQTSFESQETAALTPCARRTGSNYRPQDGDQTRVPSNYAGLFKQGNLVAAYDRSSRIHGKQIGVIRLTQTPYLEAEKDIPDEESFDPSWMAC